MVEKENKQNVLNYFKGDDLASSTFFNKYAKDELDNPNQLHKRMAHLFYKAESKYENILSKNLSDYGMFRKPLTEDAIYNLFKDFKYVIPAGSVMAGLGSKKPVSLSNCFVIDSPKDSYTEIMKTRAEQVCLMKRRGGVGYDLSKLRPRGSNVNNSAKVSTGAASFMEVCSAITKETAQDGRRGALMLSISIEHPDAQAFINAKQDLSKVTGANISVQVTDKFMRAVVEDNMFTQQFPVNVDNPTFTKEIRAKDLWDNLIHNAWNTAEPGIMFGDTMRSYSPDAIYEKYKMICTNPCHRGTSNVLTKEGLKKIIDVKEGDVVWSAEGWTNVIRKQSSGIKDVYHYCTTGGSFYGTENHKLVSYGVKIEVKDAESIDLLGGFNSNKVVKDDEYLQCIMDGLVLGDGTTKDYKNNKVVLFIGENDYDYFDSDINHLIKTGLKKSTRYNVKTTIQANELPRTFERSIPNRFMYGNVNNVKGLLRGLYSANGSVVSKRVTYKTSSSKMRDKVMILLSSIGIRSYYTTNDKKYVEFSNGEYECKESYDINISTDRDVFYHNVGFIQKYKMCKLEKHIKDIRKTNKTQDIIETKYISTEEVFDITVDNNSHTLWVDGLNVSNCGEVPLGAYDSCRLIHINLHSFVENPFTKDAKFNYQLLYEISYETQRLADDLVDLELEAIDKILSYCKDDKFETELWEKLKDRGSKGRRTGVGFTALADTIAELNVNYNSEEGLLLVDNIMQVWSKALLDSTIDMAIERGSFLDFNKESDFKNNEWYQDLKNNDIFNYNRLLKFGTRNISWNTVAPTGTVSLMAKTSSGIEPIFMPYYTRKRKASDGEMFDFVDDNGEKFQTFAVVHQGLQDFASIKHIETKSVDDWNKIYQDSPYFNATANDFNWKNRVMLQSIIQKYVTHSISSTVNLPNNISEKVVNDIYIQAWKSGLKGITVYRDGCRSGILNKVEEKDIKVDNNTLIHKRPKELLADFYTIKVKGEQFIVIVGLFEDKPYEIFAFRPSNDIKIPIHKGKIIKIKKKNYKFESDLYTIDNLGLANENIEERATTLYSSMLLRHGINILQLTKIVKKVNENITSFSSAICRILNKYSENGEIKGAKCPNCGGRLINEGGCVRCLDCDYSKCL